MKLASVASTLILFLMSLASWAGDVIPSGGATIGGGGGESVQRSSSPDLLKDYLLIDRSFVDVNEVEFPTLKLKFKKLQFMGGQKNSKSFHIPLWHRSESGTKKTIKMSSSATQLSKQFGKSGPYQLVHLLLDQWLKFGKFPSLTLVELPVLMAGSKITWSVSGLQGGKYAAWYRFFADQKRSHVRLFKSSWNRLGVWSQAGLLLHEILRYKQINYGNYDFDDTVLQKVTALLMNCLPDAPKANQILYYVEHNMLYPEKVRLNRQLESEARAACQRIPLDNSVNWLRTH